MAARYSYPKFQGFDASGDPLSGGKLYTYAAGTSTPKDTYIDAGAGTANSNPVILDSRGEAVVFISGSYKFVLKDSSDTTIWTQDNIEIRFDQVTDADTDTGIFVESAADEDIIRLYVKGSEQLRVSDGAFTPGADDDIDLGNSSHEFKDGYFDGIVYADKAQIQFTAFPEQSSNPTIGAGEVGIYSKDENGQPELVMREESNGDVVEITKGGYIAVPPGWLHGLTLSNDTDTAHDINITAGVASDSGGTVTLKLASETTKQIDATWAVGDDAGGLFSGSVAGSTWYHVFLIRKDSDGTIDAGFDTSITAANIPSGYTKYRRLGSVLTDGAANITQFVQIGDDFLWKDPPLDVNDDNPGTTAVLRTLSVPSGLKVRAHMNIQAKGHAGNASGAVYLSSPDVDDEACGDEAAPLATIGDPANNGAELQGQARVWTNTSSQIRSRNIGTTAVVTLFIATLGWLDRRGKDG